MTVARHRVVDIRRLSSALSTARDASSARAPEDTVRPDDDDARELRFLGSIVETITACGVGAKWERAIVCCDQASCDSALALRRTGDACEWYCPSCATFGAVVGWRGGAYDLTEALQQDDSDRTDAAIFTRLDELCAVRRLYLAPRLKLTLALATAQADFVVVTCAERELSELLCSLEEALSGVPQAERRLIDRFVARVDAALLACETRQELPPTLH